ncbi:MAG: serine/threonine protein kinase [Sandaracinaceae bacterium]|nr:serine/threonine protein kinase [Sandaracinaceae bacterium]
MVTTFGRYQLIERIGIGGMAEVFRATQRGAAGFERAVAIKRILPQIAADPQVVAMFVEEAKLAVQLAHPNIAQVFDLGEVDGSYFIAMEYVDGHSAETLIQRLVEQGRRLPFDAVCHILCEVAEALHYAHFAEDSAGRPLGIIHRDVSPQNILLSFGGEVKVIDFGLAKAANRLSQTQDGIVKGKLAYLSPEQAHGKTIDRRSDVFALGICAWEMLTGRRAFKRDDDRETVLAVRAGRVERVGEHVPVPPALDLVVMRALAKNRDKRYRTALEMKEHLTRFARTAGLRFERSDLRALMRETFPERFRGEPVADAIALVTRKKAERRRKRRPVSPAKKAKAPSTDTVVEPAVPLVRRRPPSREQHAWDDAETDPGTAPPEDAGHDEDTVPTIVLPEDR